MDVCCGKDDAMRSQSNHSKNAAEQTVFENLGYLCICLPTFYKTAPCVRMQQINVINEIEL